MAKARPITDVAPDMPLGAFAARVIEVRADEAQALLGDVSRNGTPEDVHARRVALRRLRTAIEVFQPALPKRAKAVRRELKEVFGALGPRRDADVALEALAALEPELVAADRPGWKGLVAEFEAERDAAPALGDAESALRAGGDAALLCAAARERGGPPAATALRGVARKRLKAVRRRLPALQEARDAESLHNLRVAAKRLRYVLEAAAPALGTPADDGARVARGLQSVLGDLHDCDVMLPRLEAHRRALRAADVAAVLAGGSPVSGARYRGVQAVETRLRARREELRRRAAAGHAEALAGLDRLATALEAP